MSKAGDQVRSLLFKQVADGYVFRAPNPRVFGPTDHYLVNEAQRDEIVAIITPRRPLLLLAATVVIIALYAVATVLSARLFPRVYVAVVTGLAAVVGAIVAILAFSPGDSTIGVVVEVVLLAATIPLVDRVLDGLASAGTVNETISASASRSNPAASAARAPSVA